MNSGLGTFLIMMIIAAICKYSERNQDRKKLHFIGDTIEWK